MTERNSLTPFNKGKPLGLREGSINEISFVWLDHPGSSSTWVLQVEQTAEGYHIRQIWIMLNLHAKPGMAHLASIFCASPETVSCQLSYILANLYAYWVRGHRCSVVCQFPVTIG